MNAPDIAYWLRRKTPDEQAEDFDTAVINAMPAARLTVIQRAVAAVEDDPTLDNLTSDLCERLGRDGVVSNLIRTALNGDAEVTAKMLLDLINKGIEDEAENEAIKAVERAEVV